MIYEAEYTIKIKLDKLFMPPGHSSDELREEIKLRGSENLKRYFNGVLFEPEKKIIFEETKFELIKP
jgi:hypothetical protein